MSWMKRVSHRTRAVDPERAAGDFTMVQAGRAIELGNDRGKLSANPPLVGTATQRFEGCAPSSPPARDEPGQWLDNEQTVAFADALEQPPQQRLPRGVRQLVQRECGEKGGWFVRQLCRGDIALTSGAGE